MIKLLETYLMCGAFLGFICWLMWFFIDRPEEQKKPKRNPNEKVVQMTRFKFRQIRLKNNLTCEKLAKVLGITESELRDFESGKVDVDGRTACAMHDIEHLGVSMYMTIEKSRQKFLRRGFWESYFHP